MAKRKSKEVEKKTYIINMKDGTRQKVTVPAHWKITFGALFPGKDINSGKSAMRFWEDKQTQQRMVITEVDSFQDDSIEIQVETVRSSDQAAKVETPQGEKTIIMRGEVREWQNPDDPKAMAGDVQFLRPSSSDNKLLGSVSDAAERAEAYPKTGFVPPRKR